MESQRDDARGRGRGGRGGGRVRTRGGSRHQARPLASEALQSRLIEELLPGRPLENPRHPKRARVLPPKVGKHPGSEFWRPDLPTPDLDASVLSPALYLQCGPGSSRASTPVMEWPGTSGASTPVMERPGPSGASTPVMERPGPSGASTSATERRVIPSSSRPPRPLREDEIIALLNYGSEEDSEGEDEEILQPSLVPRATRMWLDEEDEEVEEEAERLNINLEWPRPPQPLRPSASAPVDVSPTSTLDPIYKFKFEWRNISMPQIEPHLRRELFSEIIGPSVSFATPYDAFIAIWDREIMQVIVTETNIYAQQVATAMLASGTIGPHSRITRWQDTNVDELYTYFAIVLAMGVVVKSCLEDYWHTARDIFYTPGFAADMSYDRFQLLSKCLHFNNNEYCDITMLTRRQAKLYKIQPIVDHLNTKFSELYNLSRNLAVDESLTMWKGWLDINQFIPNKAATIGIKTYEVCESRSGYLWRFEVHAGHDISTSQDDPISGTVPALVLRLLSGLEHKGHTIWMDNFYNSPALARELKTRGFDCVGTLRTNRQFVPYELTSLTKKDMTVGQVTGCTSGDVDLLVWKDKNRVAFISTYHGLASVRFEERLKPTVACDYNVCMGGVDRKDQQLAMYPIERRRTRVWYKKLFRRVS
ncbi:piggyBac transposable element-derived protein 4 isoform X1 [Bombyx mori]|uniref:PiggyBac transposable element-derived protein domain-containing protein n=2 Tax=Bombyx mori TaxID=7091 RepID=A0A8R2R3T9_BOMMO|nr:piggyBac transposable element-derived protein 4 [Bombyx mori]